MEGKEGKEYKPNSLHQIMRRLGFFPTMRSSRAGKLTPPDLPPAPRSRLTLLMQAIPCVVRLFTPSFLSLDSATTCVYSSCLLNMFVVLDVRALHDGLVTRQGTGTTSRARQYSGGTLTASTRSGASPPSATLTTTTTSQTQL